MPEKLNGYNQVVDRGAVFCQFPGFDHWEGWTVMDGDGR